MQTQPQLPAATNRSELFIGALTPDAQAHRQRRKTLPPMQPGEAERLMAEFLASRTVTACPVRYAVAVEQR